MKQKLLCLLLALAVTLPAAGCGDTDFGVAGVSVIGGADGPTEVFVTGPGQTDGEDRAAMPEQAAPEADPDPEQAPEPDTGNGEAEAPYSGQTDPEAAAIDEDGTYNSAEDVSLYLYTYGHLPDNYITKDEARDLGWSGGSVEQVAPGCAIGGDRFGNREGILPEGSYHECDIDTIGASSRGAKRLVYSDDGQIYYTEDHYESFTLLYGEE